MHRSTVINWIDQEWLRKAREIGGEGVLIPPKNEAKIKIKRPRNEKEVKCIKRELESPNFEAKNGGFSKLSGLSYGRR